MAQVRVYSHNGIISASIAPGGTSRPNADSLYMLQQPYVAGEILEPSTAVAATTAVETCPNKTAFCNVQVEEGKRVYYEVTPQGSDLRVATASSPILQGDNLIHCNGGWRLSFLEKSE